MQQPFDHYSYRNGQELVIKGGQFTSQRKAKTVMRGTNAPGGFRQNMPENPKQFNNAYGSQAFTNDLTDTLVAP